MTAKPNWVKLYRQTLESEFWDTGDAFDYQHAFLHILLKANWKPSVFCKDGHTARVERGQYLTSIRNLGHTFHWDPHKVYKWLRFMANLNMITSESLGFGTLLTVVAYDKFQNDAYTVSNEVSNTPSNIPSNEVSNKPSTQYKNIEYIEGQKEENIFAPAEPPPETEGPGSDEAGDDDEGYMTPDELSKFLESYYAGREDDHLAAGCAVQTERG